MVTVVQLRAERRRAFRSVRTELNKFRKAFNYLHRQLNLRLEGHYTELLDVKDAQKIIDSADEADKLWNAWKRFTVDNLDSFFI